MRAAFAVVICLPLVLTGCSLSPTTTDTSPDAGIALQGTVRGGQAPIVGAHIYLLAANTDGYGQKSASLLTNVPGSTLLDTSGGATNGDYYVTSGAGGAFSITGDYSCSANTQVYLYSVGGNPGLTAGTNNAAAGLLAVLGNCPGGANAFLTTTPFVTVNEVSTVAAAYAFAGFATDAVHVSSSGSALAKTGVQNAFANAANLANLGTGAALAIPPSDPNGTAPQATVYSLANILASCVNTNGTTTACSTLLTNALSGGTTGTQPTDTATAAINIAHNPGANVDALWNLIPGTPAFGSGLTTEPNDFTLGLQFTSGGLFGPNAIAIDGSGNVWITNTNNSSYSGTGTVTELASSGLAYSGSPYSAGGMNGLVGIAIDLNTPGNAWIANDLGSSTGNVIELSSSGTLVSPSPFTAGGIAAPAGIAIDGSGGVWVSNSNNTITKLSSSGTAAPGTPYTGVLSQPDNIAIDQSGDAWIENSSTVVELNNADTAALGPPYAGGFLTGPAGIAIDHSGNAWVADAGSSSIIKISSFGTVLSGSNGYGYQTGSLNDPEGIAIDGSGNVWTANLLAGSVAELSSTGSILSGDNGFGYNDNSIATPDAIAIDGSGNVWIGNLLGNGAAANGSVTELVGAAAPVVTPLAVGVENNTLGTQP
jgi:sugar lactone lactonase YvrE